MADFFRKERDDVFKTRIATPTPPTNAWSLKSSIIFQAKNYNGAKSTTVQVGDAAVAVTCTVNGSSVTIKRADKPLFSLVITEAEMAPILARREVNEKDTLEYRVLEMLFKQHATSSSNSLLISGCTVNNFAASSAYAGHKLHLALKARTPVVNPFASGNEKEVFLVGQVLDSDCSLIKYYGQTAENKNELVNGFGSFIPRPK
jgi:hypothetical protein